MKLGPSLFRSPANLLALGLVVAGLVGIARSSGSSGSAGSAGPADPTCPEGDPACIAAPASSASAMLSTEGRTVPAEEACRDAGYLCAALEDEGRVPLRRWKDFEGTLVVHVPLPDHEDRGMAVRLQRAAAAGIRAWNGQPFPILVDERGTREAHFGIQWSYSLGGSQIGRAETRWSAATGLEVRRLLLATRSPFNQNATIDPAQIRLTAAHEMGHALGLPHSDTRRDVMYPTNSAASLTARDYRTLEALYELDDGLVIVP